jgi:hypothetical protein
MGDTKEVSISGTSISIKPTNGNEYYWRIWPKEERVENTSQSKQQLWSINTKWNPDDCTALLSYDEPGCEEWNCAPFKMSLRYASSSRGDPRRVEFELTDPSAKLAAQELGESGSADYLRDFPLARWVSVANQLTSDSSDGTSTQLSLFKKASCIDCRSLPSADTRIFWDAHDQDKKSVTISCRSSSVHSPAGQLRPYITIKPAGKLLGGSDQEWTVDSPFDGESCSALLDFNVPGKPHPSPVKLKATLLLSSRVHDSAEGYEYEFTDPSGSVSATDFPLNRWMELRDGHTANIKQHLQSHLRR